MEATEARGVMAGTRPKQVLVVEDDEDVATLLADCLETSGYTALTASGAEGLARIRTDPPDLVLLDLVMPGVDGFEFLARLPNAADGSRIPVLIVSSLGDALTSAAKSGVATIPLAVGVIPKPFDVDHLLATVDSIIGRC